MIQRAIHVQTEVHAALSAALAPIPVTTAPTGAARHVRVEGLTVNHDEIYKNAEPATLRFSVNTFDSPEGGTRSLAWTWNTLAAINEVLSKRRLTAGGTVVAEDAQAWFDPQQTEGVFTAHGYTRYRVQIGA